jgi:hypothetical protein
MARMDVGDGTVSAAEDRMAEAPPSERAGSAAVAGTRIGGTAPASAWPLALVRPEREAGGVAGGAAACGARVAARCPRARTRMPVRIALAARRVVAGHGGDGGAATAEYAIATMAAVAFAGLLVVILQSDEVRGMLLDLVRRALTYDR